MYLFNFKRRLVKKIIIAHTTYEGVVIMMMLNKPLMLLGVGVVLGVVLTISKEDEIYDLYYDMKKARRKMMRKYSQFADNF